MVPVHQKRGCDDVEWLILAENWVQLQAFFEDRNEHLDSKKYGKFRYQLVD
jgi:hypothetical protein